MARRTRTRPPGLTLVSALVAVLVAGPVPVAAAVRIATADNVAAWALIGLPVVSSISPTSGSTAGGTTVTITGLFFTGATAVHFGGSPATNFGVVSDTSIIAGSPAGSGTVDVTVTGPGGTSATSSADQFTYLVPGATYVSLTPARILDSRNGTGLSGTFTSTVPRSLQVTGVGGVPSGAIAVTGNLTVTNQTSAGYAALTTVSTPVPSTSTLNFPVGDNRANGVTAPLGSGGVLWITYVGSVGGATTDLLFDVTGYFQ